MAPFHRSCRSSRPSRSPAVPGLLATLVASSAAGQSPFAVAVVDYLPGTGVVEGYDDPTSALGEPSRFTPDPLFPSAVTPFASAYLPTQVCSIGGGGHLAVEFETPVTDDPRNPFGIDLIVFGNSFFIDAAYPAGVVGGFFGDGGTIEVSPDGSTWAPIPNVAADGLFPTLAFEDVGPYPTRPGSVPTDFTRPVDPLLGPMLVGMTHEEVVEAYSGGGGGAGVDLATVGLSEIRFLRVSLPADSGFTIEIDAASDVAPEIVSADLDGSGTVDGGDLAALLADWGGVASDLDGSGTVDGGDLAALLAAWGGRG